MRKKRFSLAQLLLAIALTAAAVLGCGLLAVRAWMGEGGRSLVELSLIHISEPTRP